VEKDTFILLKSRDTSPAAMQLASAGLGTVADIAKVVIAAGLKAPGGGGGGSQDPNALLEERVVAAAKAELAKGGHHTACIPELQTPVGSSP
jgi:hypothetical protein